MYSLPRLKLYTTLKQYLYILNPIRFFTDKKNNHINNLIIKLSKLTESKYVIPVTQARVGLYLSIKHLLNSKKKEVLLSPYTIAEVISIVVCAGGKPVFCDIDRKSCNISYENIEKKISNKTGLILVTHFYGNSCEMTKIKKLADKYSLPLVEDAAQAFSAKSDGRHCGTFGNAGVYSFGLYKNINAFYGGAIVTNDLNLKKKIEEEMKSWPNINIVYFYKKVINGILIDVVTSKIIFSKIFFYFFRWAFKNNIDSINNKLKIDVNPKLFYKMPKEYLVKLTNKQAYLIVSQLDTFIKDTESRIKNASLWTKYLSPLKNKIIIPDFKKDYSHIYWYFPIQYENRKELVMYVQEHGHDISESYHRNCADLNCFKSFHTECPNSHMTANELIYLPCYPSYPEKNIKEVSNIILSFFK